MSLAQLQPQLVIYYHIIATLGSILDSHSENLASFSLQDGATEWHYFLVWTTHPQLSFSSQCCAVSPPLIRYVRCPHPNKVCAVSPPQSGMCGVPPFQYMFFSVRCPPPLCHTWLCLRFVAKLRIWQVPALKMQDGATKWYYNHSVSHPPTRQPTLILQPFFQCCAVSPTLIRYVRCPKPQ